MNLIDFYIGDVHGRSDLLAKLLTFLQRHARMRDAQPRYTFLGDLIDRGPDPVNCMEMAISVTNHYPGSAILLGNHEQMMLDAIKTRGKSEMAGNWALNGGLKTVEAYSGKFDIEGFLRLMAVEYRHHFNMIDAAPLFVQRQGLVAAHAGVDRTSALETQGAKTLCWIREPFLDHVDAEVLPVIHGHSIVGPRPVVTENRISLDTGAYKSERLSACIVDHGAWDISFAQATPKDARYIEAVRLDRGHGTVLDNPERLFKAPAPSQEPAAYTDTRPCSIRR
jgi:serine/threonine protein phosphatase 1|nr:metallophosphoesterase [Neorhizobium tomejilense]